MSHPLGETVDEIALPSLDRVLVVGTCCAGKSSFAEALGRRLQRPTVDLDPLYWGPNWTPQTPERFQAALSDIAASPRWIVSGNYTGSGTLDILWPRASSVVWLNYPYRTVFWRAWKRTVLRSLSKQELWHGNRESFRLSFLSRDSVLWWALTTHHRCHHDLAVLRENGRFPELAWTELEHPRQARRFLHDLPGGRAVLTS